MNEFLIDKLNQKRVSKYYILNTDPSLQAAQPVLEVKFQSPRFLPSSVA